VSQFDLSGKSAVVTGVFGKLGPVWCEALLNAGANVVGIDLPSAVESTAATELATVFGKRIAFLRADVTSRKSLAVARDRCTAAGTTPDVLVNNAGIDQPPGSGERYRIEDIPADAFTRVLEVNVTGAFLAAQIFGPAMIRARNGSVINIGSLYATVSPDARFYDHIAGEVPFTKPPAYGASKGALLNLTRYLATHWGSSGVRVNMLSPGGVEGGQDPDFRSKFTARVPLGRMAVSDDLVGPLIFLASDASRYVTGTDLRVDGGFTAW
jgi:NAD(P)-dependent dehydrogenase (short-subunit alcohol dehydrogenase family)